MAKTADERSDLTDLVDYPRETLAQLSCPVLSLFGLSECGAELVARLAPQFIKL
ncbi:Hypothetical protein NGAL_HAMBI1145_26790 [Neorhizobium galegae bv. officinalis]|uniref:Uncharacterized protein n=1 Tax=Neorhizobium galegae bv. officinalis TaxID=323656 RepID=A0A0T7FJ75_NEOGA|nr:hypothetical protein [Neorhizobium galegae]CDZ35076.1 Hypothetical protein NGAL_HAMBI1145_26790 [Neorhizobium galegae bv. officinalis]